MGYEKTSRGVSLKQTGHKSVKVGKRVTEYILCQTSLLESVSEWIGITDENYRIVYMNRAAKKEYGDGVGKKCYQVFQSFKQPCYEKGLPCSYREIITKGRRRYAYAAKDTKGRWLNVHSSLLKAGGRRYVIEIVHDITERKRLEEELRRQSLNLEKIVQERTLKLKESEAKFRGVYESIMEGIMLNDLSGKILECNKTLENMLGYTRDELKLMKWQEIASPQYLTPVDGVIKEQVLKKGCSGFVEKEYIRKDGSKIPVEEVWSVLKGYEDEPGLIVCAIRDISDRKKMEGELLRSEERYRLLVESSPDMIFVHCNGMIVFINRAGAARLGGQHPEQFIGWPVMEIVHPQYRESVEERIKYVVEDGLIQPLTEEKFIRLDGSEIDVETWTIPFTYQGKPAVQVIARDITERKTLEKKLEQRTIEIYELNESLVKRLSEKISAAEKFYQLRGEVLRTPDISTGLNKLLQGVVANFNADAAAVLILDREGQTVEVRNLAGEAVGVAIGQKFLLGEQCRISVVENAKPISISATEQNCLPGMASIHHAPIMFKGEVYGILSVGERNSRALDSSDLMILVLYAELASNLFELQSLVVSPVLESARSGVERLPLEYGASYLVFNDIEEAYMIFANQVHSGLEGLCITRRFPPKIRQIYHLEKTPVVWLSEIKSDTEKTIYSIQDLSILIGDFLEKTIHGIVLIDGFEYLIMTQGFDRFLNFLQLNTSRFAQKEAIMIAPLLHEALDSRSEMLIRREMMLYKPV